MKKIELYQVDLVEILIEKLKNCKDYKSSSGVYNNQDPTAYEKHSGSVWLQYGFTIPQDEEEGPYNNFPHPEIIKVSVMNNTWGYDITIHTSAGIEMGYLDSEEWYRCTKDFLRALRKVLTEGKVEEPMMFHHSDPYDELYYGYK